MGVRAVEIGRCGFLVYLVLTDLSFFTLSLCSVSVARAEPGVAKGSAAAFARSASFFICIALLLGGFFFVVGFFVLLSMEFWRENCGLPPTRGREISCACSCGHSEPGWALSLSLLRFAILRRRARQKNMTPIFTSGLKTLASSRARKFWQRRVAYTTHH